MHFLFVLNFGYPLNKQLKTKLDFYSFGYCYPYFFQDWRLFTPCPKNNFTIYAIYKVNHQTHYALPLQEVLYQKNKFTGKEFLMLSLTDAAAYVADDKRDDTLGITRFRMNANYNIFKNAVAVYLNQKHSKKITDLKLILLLTDIKTKKRQFLYD